MKKALFAFTAAAALTLGSAAFAQSSPSPTSGDKAPPTSDTGTTGSPDSMTKPDAGKKATKSKPGSSTSDDTGAGSKTGTSKP